LFEIHCEVLLDCIEPSHTLSPMIGWQIVCRLFETGSQTILATPMAYQNTRKCWGWKTLSRLVP
jgi:hypothetical protein